MRRQTRYDVTKITKMKRMGNLEIAHKNNPPLPRVEGWGEEKATQP